jgi:hypothetical protein
VITEVNGAIEFSTPFAERVFFRKAFPSRGFERLFHSTLNELILAAICMFDPKMLIDGKKSSQRGTFPSEAVLQQEFCRAMCQLIPPSVLFCAEMAAFVKSGRVDFFIGAGDGWAVEFLRLGDGISSHRDRFVDGGKYECPEIKTFRVVDFKAAGSRPSFHAIADMPAVHMAIVFSEDFTQATVFQGQAGGWAESTIHLGQSVADIQKALLQMR